jgi:hypothetical protein
MPPRNRKPPFLMANQHFAAEVEKTVAIIPIFFDGQDIVRKESPPMMVSVGDLRTARRISQ